MLTEMQGQKVKADLEKKTLADLRSEEAREEQKKALEIRMQIYDSFVYIDEIKKSDEVFLFQSKLEL